jgi:hypothetical protein
VQERTVVALLRLRHQLTSARGRASATTLLVEEAAAFAWTGSKAVTVAEGIDALGLLVADPAGEPPRHVAERQIGDALSVLDVQAAALKAFARARADALLADHRRVREASEARGKYTVKALLPADVIGLFVLLPEVR